MKIMKKILSRKIDNRVLALMVMLLVISCYQQNGRPKSEFRYVDITIHDIGKRFKASEVKAILFTDWYNIEEAETIQVLGNLGEVESVIGREIKAQKVVDDPLLVNRIAQDFLEAERFKEGYLISGYVSDDNVRAIFITKYGGYMIKIDADDKVVFGPDYASEQLRKDLEKIGFLELEEPFTQPEGGSGANLP